MATGWLFKAAESNGDTFAESVAGDALFVLEGASNSFSFGHRSYPVPYLLLDSAGLRTSSLACGSNVLTTSAGRLNAAMLEGVASSDLPVDSVTEFRIASSNIAPRHFALGSVWSDAIADSNVFERHIADGAVTSDKIGGALSASVGGTGRSNLDAGRLLVGNGSNALVTSDLLQWTGSELRASKLALGSTPDVEAAINDARADMAAFVAAVGSGAITNASIASGAVTSDKIGGALSASVGGTGRSNLDAGRLLVGNGSNALVTSDLLQWTGSELRASKLAIGSTPDVEAAINDARADMAVLAAAVGTGGAIGTGSISAAQIADLNVLERHIADGAVTPNKMLGLAGAPAGRLVYSGAGNALSHSSSLEFDESASNLSARNAYFGGRAHAGGEIVIGLAGATRFRLAISGNDLVVSRIDANDAETPYVNLGDVVSVLQNVGVAP